MQVHQQLAAFRGGILLGAPGGGGKLIEGGDSTTPLVEDTANHKFISLYGDNGATSGDARMAYLRLYLTGAGGGGECLRAFTSVQDVAGATAHGAHISLNFGTSGKLTGQGVAGRFTLHMPSTALPASNVTYAALQAEIWSDAATSDPAGNLLSAIRVLNAGNATGMADVDDDCALMELIGWTAGSGNMLETGLTAATVNAACTVALRIRIAGTNYWLPVATAIT